MKHVLKFSNGVTMTKDIDKLLSFQKQLDQKYISEVGVLGSKTNRTGENKNNLSNADIGLLHEKGSVSKRIPARSWLEMPLTVKSKELMVVAKTLIDNMTANNIVKSYRILGIKAEEIIQRAFSSRGFGQWVPNSPVTIRRKKSDMPLIDTAQLRKSVSSRVVTL